MTHEEMKDKEILAVLAKIAREALGHEGQLEPNMRLIEDLKLDSIRLLTLATEVEDHFRICLDEDDEASITTVSDLVTLVEKKIS